MRTFDDEQLLHAIAQGDTGALRELHRRHAAAAVRFAWRMIGNTADAEEAVADAFCEVWQHAGRFQGRSQVRTWLLGIVRHKVLDRLRQADRAPLADDSSSPGLGTDFADDPADVVERWQDAQRLQRCFEQLSVVQREALYLAVVEGLSTHEIAQLQDVPAGTVATRIHHARHKLRVCLMADERQANTK